MDWKFITGRPQQIGRETLGKVRGLQTTFIIIPPIHTRTDNIYINQFSPDGLNCRGENHV